MDHCGERDGDGGAVRLIDPDDAMCGEDEVIEFEGREGWVGLGWVVFEFEVDESHFVFIWGDMSN